MQEIGRRKIILGQVLILVGFIGAVYVLVSNPVLREGGGVLDEELERKSGEVQRYIVRTGALPSKDTFDRLEKGKLALEERLKNIVDYVDPKKVRISGNSAEASLYFIERLHSSIKRISEEAGSRGIRFPENLGFSNMLPKESMVDTLLRQLEMIELVMDALMTGNNIEISAIRPLKAADYIQSLNKEVLYIEIPVEISMKVDMETLINLFLSLKNTSPIVSVQEVHIKSSESYYGIVEASVVLTTFMVNREANL